jgi:hypothetical protein
MQEVSGSIPLGSTIPFVAPDERTISNMRRGP